MTAASPQIEASSPIRHTREKKANDFTDLSHLITTSGLMRRRYGYYWTKLLAVPLVLAAFVLAFIWIGDTWWQLFTAAALAVIFTQVAMLGHDAAHRQIFRSGRWNDWTSLIIGNLLVGMSYGWWQHKHTRHHANPNKIGSDPDIELPVISFTPRRLTARTASAAARLGHGASGRVLLPDPAARRSVAARVERAPRVLARAAASAQPSRSRSSPSGSSATSRSCSSSCRRGSRSRSSACSWACSASTWACPSHRTTRACRWCRRSVKLDFLRRQVLMSRNIARQPRARHRHGRAELPDRAPPVPVDAAASSARAPMIAAYCRDHGVPYTQTGLCESYGIVVRINRVGLGERDPFECPMLQQRQAV